MYVHVKKIQSDGRRRQTLQKSHCQLCARGSSNQFEDREKEHGAEVLNIYYICIFSISITFPPACLPAPAYWQYVRKLFHWKRHIFPLSLLPPPPTRKNENKTDVSPPRKTRLWSIFIRHNNSNKQNVLDEIIHNDATRNCTKIVENIFIICKLFF